jgi:hypothetical protein
MKKYIITLVLIIVCLLGIQQYHILTTPREEDSLLQHIILLEKKLDSISNKKDSVRKVIDSTHVKIVTNEKHYQERINTIMLQSSGADSSFITDYIRQYRSKNDSIDIQ